jgi:hypothetical protein
MTPTLLTLAGSFTLSAPDAQLTMSPREICIRRDCVSTGQASVDADGTWRFGSGVWMRWSSNVDASVSLDGRTWVDAKLSFLTPSESPPRGLEVLGERHPGVAPGRWTRETDDCDRRRPVWVFVPIVAGQPSMGAYPRREGWAVRTGVDVVMCSDAKGTFGGVPR